MSPGPSYPHHFSSCVGGSLSRYHRGVSGTVLARESTAEVAAAGTGFLQVVKRGQRSVVCRAFAASPLKLLTPRNHGAAAWIYSASYGGGLVGGDALRLAVDVGPGAMALLSTQSSTKVYRSDRGTSTHLDALVGDGGLLVVAPDPTVCFAGSSYRQRQQIDLSGAGALVLVDWLSSGRRAAGERWAFDRYSSRTTLRVDGRLTFYDGLWLDTMDGDISERMGRFDVLATVADRRRVARGGGRCRDNRRQCHPGCPPCGRARIRVTRCPGMASSCESPARRSSRWADSFASTSGSCPCTSATIPGRASGDRSRSPRE